MIRKIKYVLLLLLTAAIYNSQAQNSQVMYHMNIPQRHFLNPALRSTNSVYIGLPVISGINLNINNNFFNFSDVLINRGDSVISILHPDYELGDFMKKIKDVNAIEPQVMFQLFGLGFSVGDLYVFLDINEKVDANIALPGDILRLGFLGNEQFVGDKLDLSSLRTDVMWYHEVGLGFSKDITDRLRIGVKGKMYMGMATVAIDNRSLGVTVNEDYTHVFDADLTVNLSAPATTYINAENMIDSVIFNDSAFEETSGIIDYFLKSGNRGLGIDIGAEYTFNDRLRASASITDLGYIRWKRDITNLNADSRFEFSGLDMLDVYTGDITFDSLAMEMVDSLSNSFSLDQNNTPFTTYLPFGVSLGGSFNLTKSVSVGVLSYTRFVGKQVKEALTLSANVNLGNALSTTLAYTAANHRYDNLGLGLAFRGGWFQFYFLADRIPVTWNKIIAEDIDTPFGNNAIPIPSSWNTIHFRFGMNLCFGNNVRKKNDKPMVVVKQELEE